MEKNGEITYVKPKNCIVQWMAPDVQINKRFSFLGVNRVDPNDYIKNFGDTLKDPADLPSFVNEIKTPDGIVLAAHEPKKTTTNAYYDLEGDIHALDYIDLEKEGLGEYKSYLKQNNINDNNTKSNWNSSSSSHESIDVQLSQEENTSNKTSDFFASSSDSSKTLNEKLSAKQPDAKIVDRLIEQIFHIVDKRGDGRITKDEAQRTLSRINTRMSKQYDEKAVNDYFSSLCTDYLDYENFRAAFIKISDSSVTSTKKN